MNSLIGIRTTNEIVQFKDEIYATDTELQRAMSLYEEGETNDGPQLNPMMINWRTVNERWNEELFLQFLTYAEDQGYVEGRIEGDDEDELREMFYARVNRMVGVINTNRPRPKETVRQTEERVQNRNE